MDHKSIDCFVIGHVMGTPRWHTTLASQLPRLAYPGMAAGGALGVCSTWGSVLGDHYLDFTSDMT